MAFCLVSGRCCAPLAWLGEQGGVGEAEGWGGLPCYGSVLFFFIYIYIYISLCVNLLIRMCHYFSLKSLNLKEIGRLLDIVF